MSSAYPSVPGLERREFLRELVSARRAIVVAGAHGKGTTAAMIAFVLDEAGLDPAWLIGAPVPQLGSNAGSGAGWLVVEGDESDRTVFSLPAEIAVLTNIDLDHHTEFASEAELVAAFEAWLAAAPQVVRDAPAYDGPLALPGALNRLNAGTALAALELAGVARADAEAALARFTGTGRRFEVHELKGVTVVDDYGHHPTEIAATVAADPRALRRGAASRALPAAPLFAHAPPGAAVRESARRGRRDRRDRRLSGPRGADRGRHRQVDRRRAQRPRPPGRLDADGRARGRLPLGARPAGRRRARRRAQATSIAPSGCSPEAVGDGERLSTRGERQPRQADDDRYRRACPLVRAAAHARRAAGGPPVGARRGRSPRR